MALVAAMLVGFAATGLTFVSVSSSSVVAASQPVAAAPTSTGASHIESAALTTVVRAPAPNYVTPALGTTGTVTTMYTLPDIPLGTFQNAILPGSLDDDRGVMLGSIGSGLFPLGDDEFWTITDRGPNPEVRDDVRTFILPTYDPTLVRVKVQGSAITVLESIPITNADGEPVTGLPNRAAGEESPPLAADATTELPYNINGLDPEGIVQTSNGHFWIADEYGPSLVELTAHGRIVARHLPAGAEDAYRDAGVSYPVVGSLPAQLQRRKANRGLEDLALLPDGRTIVAALQSSVVVAGQKDRIVTELLTFDTKRGKTLHEFAYQFDSPVTFGDRGRKLKISALAPVDANRVVVQERTDFQSRYYLVTLDPDDPMIFGDDKKLVVNLEGVEGVPTKIEGMWFKSPDTLVLSSDNDFGVAARPYAPGQRTVTTGEKTHIIEVKLK